MARIYISSTYVDLVEYRKAVDRALSRMEHHVVAMEDYVATDQRSQDKCLKDIGTCDLYIGIFAWRYGYVPPDNNPEQKSITELEYDHAGSKPRPITRLNFLVDPKAPWPREFMDEITKENDAGQKIEKLRAKLAKNVNSFFTTPADLATVVTAAVANWQKPATVTPAVIPPQFREIIQDTIILYLDIDEKFFQDISKALAGSALKVIGSPKALLAETSADFQEIEKLVRQCKAAIVLLSPSALAQLSPRSNQTAIILELLRARTQSLFTVWRGPARADLPKDWNLNQVVDLGSENLAEVPGSNSILELATAIRSQKPAGGRVIGLPLVIVAMNQLEATELLESPDELKRRVAPETYNQFLKIREPVEINNFKLTMQYSPRREDWKPFPDNHLTALQAIESVVDKLNQRTSAVRRDRLIKLQYYPLDALLDQPDKMKTIYVEIARTGCVVLVDELSMFHWRIQSVVQSTFLNRQRVSMVTVSPVDPCTTKPTPNQLLESELRKKLGDAFDRYSLDFDPQCEFGVSDERRLKRWLHTMLPQTVSNLREPPPDVQALDEFAAEVGLQHQQGIEAILFDRP
jgi:Domain of unknown function (DUF4062)